MNAATDLRIAIAGFGAIGRTVAARLAKGIPGLRLTAVGVRDPGKTRADLPPGVVATALAEHADIIVQWAPASLLPTIAEPAQRADRTAIVLLRKLRSPLVVGT